MCCAGDPADGFPAQPSTGGPLKSLRNELQGPRGLCY